MLSFKRSLIAIALILPSSLLKTPDAWSQTTHRPKIAVDAKSLETATPFQNNNGSIPPPSQYSGPLFTTSHAWPEKPLPPLKNAPWQAAIHNGKITVQNAPAYAAALKAYVSKNARTLLMNYPAWNAGNAHWYTEPWLGSQREAIHGTYAAGEFGPAIFPNTGLRATFNTHVLTYYDERAAYSLYKFWGTSALSPKIQTPNSQFDEGSVVVKAAVFASEDKSKQLNWWDAMNGAQVWPLYVGVGPVSQDPAPPPQVWSGYVAQFDIIVKDTQSSPKTGWVFITLVYDRSAPGDFWDKMVPLGAQWGNDPQATRAGQPLVENWNNPKAPLYSTQTLGWGGRLSGPNDGGRNNIAVNGKVLINEPDSSCMSCHSTAEWNVQQHRMDSFLLPSFATANPPGFQLCGDNGKPDPNGSNICSPAPGSTAWMKWFQNRPGTQPMDVGSIAMDFDEVFSFKSLKLWWLAVAPKGQPMPMLLRVPGHGTQFNQYTGAPLPAPRSH
jgi:hypothetical protein